MAKKTGRPMKITDEIVEKLEKAFAKGFNISEACHEAGICRDTYYAKCDSDKEFSDKMEAARTNLQRRAKINLAAAIENGDLEESKYYLERKCKDEFSVKTELVHTADVNVKKNPYDELSVEELRALAQACETKKSEENGST